jgi:hypothetical protein
MAICRLCALEMDPETIPIGPEFMTELIDVAPKDPYR